MKPIERLMTVKEVAELLRKSASWVYKAAERGEVPALKIGANLRFDPDQLREWLAALAFESRTQGPVSTDAADLPGALLEEKTAI